MRSKKSFPNTILTSIERSYRKDGANDVNDGNNEGKIWKPITSLCGMKDETKVKSQSLIDFLLL